MNIEQKIGLKVAELTGREARRWKGSYKSLVDSHMVTEWGWKQPTIIDGWKVCVSQPSPRHKGDKLVAYFDYIKNR